MQIDYGNRTPLTKSGLVVASSGLSISRDFVYREDSSCPMARTINTIRPTFSPRLILFRFLLSILVLAQKTKTEAKTGFVCRQTSSLLIMFTFLQSTRL